jgi:hypothetical protein
MGKKSDPSPADRTFGLFIARRANKKWGNRFLSEETPVSKDPLFNPSQLAARL